MEYGGSEGPTNVGFDQMSARVPSAAVRVSRCTAPQHRRGASTPTPFRSAGRPQSASSSSRLAPAPQRAQVRARACPIRSSPAHGLPSFFVDAFICASSRRQGPVHRAGRRQGLFELGHQEGVLPGESARSRFRPCSSRSSSRRSSTPTRTRTSRPRRSLSRSKTPTMSVLASGESS